jgi:hypothetical protein
VKKKSKKKNKIKKTLKKRIHSNKTAVIRMVHTVERTHLCHHRHLCTMVTLARRFEQQQQQQKKKKIKENSKRTSTSNRYQRLITLI